MTVRVSVVMPVRDAGPTVRAAVESLLRQTFSDFELLAVNDHSRDDTAEQLEALRRVDGRVRLLPCEGRGLVDALNTGVRHARAPLLARMDGDDESLPERFAHSVAALENSSLTGVGTGVESFRDDRPVSPNLQAYTRWLSSLTTCERLFHDRYVESPLCHPTVMLRTQAVRDAGAYLDGDFPEDWELWLRLLSRGARLTCLPHVLHRWRDHDARATRTDRRYARERQTALKVRYLHQHHGAGPVDVWGAGDTGVGLARALVQHGTKVERLIDLNPRKIGQRIHGAKVVFPDDVGSPGARHLLVAVSAKGARAEIRAWLESRGWVEGEHFTCAA